MTDPAAAGQLHGRGGAAAEAPAPDLTATQVMARLQIKDRDALYALVKSKRLPAYRLGRQLRFTPEAVEAFRAGGLPAVPQPAPGRQRTPQRPEWLRGVRPVIRR